MTPQGLHHVALQVRDVETVAAFYRDVLGCPELKRHLHSDGRLRSIWLGTGGPAFIAVEGLEGARGSMGWSMVALTIDAQRREQVLAELEAQGHRPVRQTGFTAYFQDPEGNLVGLSHYPAPAEATSILR